MKRCVKCNKSYADESLNYCLDDGTTLVFEGEEQTVVVQKSPPKKGKFWVWLVMFGFLFLGGISLIFGYVFYNYYLKSNANLSSKSSNNANISGQNKVNSSPSATPFGTPRIDRTPPPSNESSSTSNETDEEITPIAWTTSTAGFKGENGQVYKFECPPDGIASAIWGSDIYTGDSSICTAAVHVGLITVEDGGTVTVEFRPGRQMYGSTNRNGITSNTFGEYPRSFVVR